MAGHGGASGEASFALGGCKLGSCAEPAPVESSPNDIPVFSRTFQVLWGYLSDTHKQRGQCNYTEPVFWVLFLCCSIFFFLKRTQESRFFGDKTICGQGSPVCIITKYCQLHNVFTNLFHSESFPERDFILAC